ncbi:hypothetical protein LUZ60_004762 [Juncus effusus]|nr:hypothetical protein LUZ60_004762 [Juncus effusus]
MWWKRSIREEEVGRLIEHISLCSSRNEVVDLRKKLIQTVNDMISRAIIGNKCKNRDELLQELERTLEILGGFSSVDLFPSSWLIRFFSGTAGKTKRNRHAIAHLLDDIIEQHRESTINGDGEEDFVQLLLRMHDNDTLLDMEAVQQVILDLFTGSTWNMSTTLEWAMSELICNPRVMKKAQSEVREVVKGCTTISESHLCKLNYLRQVIKETLRLHSPPLHLRRQCRERCRISGYDIPEGAAIMINAFAIGTDPNYWEDPEEFKPERFTNNKMDFVGTSFNFLPFGAGRRMCPGISFAMANLEITMASLLYHFDWKQPSGAKPEEIDMSKSNNVTNRRKSPLQLVAIPYKPCVV